MTSVVSRNEPSSTLEHFEHGINRVAASRDGRFVATSDVDMNVTVFQSDVSVFGRNLGSPNEKIRPTERIRGLAFSPDSEILYIAAGDQILAFNTSDWSKAWTYEAPRSFGFLIISPVSLDVAENGDVAAAFDNGSIVIWDRHGNRKQSIRDNDSPRWLRFVDGGQLLVGSDSFSICCWPLGKAKGKQKIRLQDRIFGLDADPPGRTAVTRSLTEITLWHLSSQTPIVSLNVGPGIPLVAIHPSGKWILYGERNRIRTVDHSGALLDDFELSVASALSVCFASGGTKLLIGCTEGKLIQRSLGTKDSSLGEL